MMAVNLSIIGVLASVLVGIYFVRHHYNQDQTFILGNIKLDFGLKKGLHLSVRADDGDLSYTTLVTATLGVGLTTEQSYVCPESPTSNGGNSLCREWRNIAQLEISPSTKHDKCYSVTWQALAPDIILEDCFDMKGVHWYGGGETYHQPWPLAKNEVKMQRYVSGDFVPEPHEQFGGVIDNYWLTSSGVGVYISEDVPLYHGSNSSHVCFRAMYQTRTFGQRYPHLSYTICNGGNILETHKLMTHLFIDKPTDVPDEEMFRYPIWSSWAKYKTQINQTSFLEFAKEIIKHDFPSSQIELDDDYTIAYGDFVFNPDKFPQPEKMLRELHTMGFRVTSWIMPFANVDSQAFKEGSENGYFLGDHSPYLVRWWQGTAAIIDPFNKKAVEWWVGRLNKLRDLGIDSFKFDAGEICYLPKQYLDENPTRNPGFYTKYYVKMVAQFGKQIETRVGFQTQRYPIFVRMLDKDSRWGHDNGLRSLIPTALQFSLLGYHFILPDMIGGNGYGEEIFLTSSILPPKELFIRWLQVTTFLPSIQFSFVPWQYDSQTIKISQNMVKLHAEYVAPKCISLAHAATKTGEPIIRPLWWNAPDDPVTMEIDTEFLIGNEVLVAPILEDEARHRDIYLPKGKWKDMLHGVIYDGPRWIKGFPIQIDEVAYFELMDKGFN